MAATKEQELKVLEKIKKIVGELGKDSYIGMAFESCFEIAEDNIENDFGCSMKQREEKARKDAAYFQDVANTLSSECEKVKKEKEKLKAALEKTKKRVMDRELYINVYNIVSGQQSKVNESIMMSAKYIAEFKEGSETRKKAIGGMADLFKKKAILDKTEERLEEIEPENL